MAACAGFDRWKSASALCSIRRIRRGQPTVEGNDIEAIGQNLDLIRQEQVIGELGGNIPAQP